MKKFCNRCVAFLLCSMLALQVVSAPQTMYAKEPVTKTTEEGLSRRRGGVTPPAKPKRHTKFPYVINLKTFVFHRTSCPYTVLIRKDNYMTSEDARTAIIKDGYRPCGYCRP